MNLFKMKICDVNQGLTECNLVSQLRSLQERLKEIEKIRLLDIVNKHEEDLDSAYKNRYCMACKEGFVDYIQTILQQKSRSNIKNFMNELIEYIEITQEADDINATIKDIKNKLGIS